MSVKKISEFFSKLTPKMEVAGLWIADGLVSFYNLSSRVGAAQASFRLPPGVVKEGKVHNKKSLVKVLTELNKRTSTNKRNQSVILTIPTANVYLQPFSLPSAAAETIAESARLNMRMISPIEVDNAYYDWQKLGEDTAGQIEMAGAFAPKDVVDQFIECVQDAGYSVAAVEFSTLSLARAATKAGVIDDKTPAILLEVVHEGINFSINHLGHLFFHHFALWSTLGGGGKKIDTEKFNLGLTDEVRRIVNFYSTNRKGQEVKKTILAASSFSQEIKKVVNSQFPGMDVQIVDAKQVSPVVGAALRGAVPRSADHDISLASLSAVEVFGKDQLANFVVVWRNIMMITFSFLLLVFLSAALILQQTSNQVAASDPFQGSAATGAELKSLETEVSKFNALVSIVEGLRAERKEFNKVIQKIDDISGPTVSIIRVNIQAGRSLVLVEGIAANEAAITAFKDVIESQPQFGAVDLSLSDIRTQPDGTELFSLNFKIESLDF